MNDGDELRESWFGARERVSRASGAPAVAVYERSRAGTFTLGAVIGAMGGACALVVAGAVDARRFELHFEIAVRIGHALRGGANAGFAAAALAGAIFGGVLALVMRHAARFFARAIFGGVAGALAWFCVHLGLVTRHMATLPLAPMLAGAAVLGVMIAFVPSARRITA